MKKVLAITGVTVLALSLTGGAVSAMSGSNNWGNWDRHNRGGDSSRVVDVRTRDNREVKNNNNVDVKNDNDQKAKTGDVKVKRNTTVGLDGEVRSGDARNANDTATLVDIDNSNSSSAVLEGGNDHDFDWIADNLSDNDDRRGDSRERVTVRQNSNVEVKNNNNVDVNNDSKQEAHSGDVKVKGNTTVGDVTSGNASNTNTTTTRVVISN